MGRNVQPQADEPTERKWLRLAAGIFIGVFIQRKLAGKPEPPARTRSVRVAAEQAPPAPREQPGAHADFRHIQFEAASFSAVCAGVLLHH
jgi:hypothetical protein